MPELQAAGASPHGSRDSDSLDSQSQAAFIKQIDTSLTPPKFSRALIVVVIALLLAVVEYFAATIMVATKKSKLSTLESRIGDAKQQLETSPLKELDQEALQLSQGVKAFTEVSGSLVDYTKLWNDLRQRVVDGTRLTTLSVDKDGAIILTGEAKSYTDIAKLIASLKNRSESIKEVKAVSSSLKDKLVNFSLTASYQPKTAPPKEEL